MYRTVIVEDDPMIATINQTFLGRDPRFALSASFHSGLDAMPWLRTHPTDLLILDVYMPRMTGLELLRELRAEEITLDVVMVTAANDSKTVDALLKLGVVDYLVKPFTAQRFQQALDTFCRHRGGAGRSAVRQPRIVTHSQGTAGGHPGTRPGAPGQGSPGGVYLRGSGRAGGAVLGYRPPLPHLPGGTGGGHQPHQL